jgi:hypothetical protein
VDNIERLFEIAKAKNITTAISPHYYYPTDHGWYFEGGLEKLMHKIGMFDRKGPLDLEGFENSGADWMPQYKKISMMAKQLLCLPTKSKGFKPTT